jgi:hypothetical protein
MNNHNSSITARETSSTSSTTTTTTTSSGSSTRRRRTLSSSDNKKDISTNVVSGPIWDLALHLRVQFKFVEAGQDEAAPANVATVSKEKLKNEVGGWGSGYDESDTEVKGNCKDMIFFKGRRSTRQIYLPLLGVNHIFSDPSSFAHIIFCPLSFPFQVQSWLASEGTKKVLDSIVSKVNMHSRVYVASETALVLMRCRNCNVVVLIGGLNL